LEPIRILIFINEEPTVALANARSDKGIVTQKLICKKHLIAKVEETAPREDGPIRAIGGGELTMFLAEPLECICMGTNVLTNLHVVNRFTPQRFCACTKACSKRIDLIRTNPLLLCSRDVPRNVTEESRWISERGKSRETEFKEVFPKKQHHLRAAEHAELAGDAEAMGILTKQLIAPSMKGLDWRCCISVRHESIDTPLHLICGTIGERKCQDLFWCGTLLCNQPCHSSSDDLRLSSPCPSDDKERPFTMRDRLVLIVIEICKKVLDPLFKCPRCAHGNPRPYGDLITLR